MPTTTRGSPQSRPLSLEWIARSLVSPCVARGIGRLGVASRCLLADGPIEHREMACGMPFVPASPPTARVAFSERAQELVFVPSSWRRPQ
jgi:hypothetical protein